jgi:hypothetical protein
VTISKPTSSWPVENYMWYFSIFEAFSMHYAVEKIPEEVSSMASEPI